MCLTVDHHTNFVLMFNQLLCFCGQFFWPNICDWCSLFLWIGWWKAGFLFPPLTVKTTYDVINQSPSELNQADPPHTSHLGNNLVCWETVGTHFALPSAFFWAAEGKHLTHLNQSLRLHLRCLGSSFLMYSSSIGMEQRAAADICSFIGVMHYRYSWEVLPVVPTVLSSENAAEAQIKSCWALSFDENMQRRAAVGEPADWFSQLSVSCRPLIPFCLNQLDTMFPPVLIVLSPSFNAESKVWTCQELWTWQRSCRPEPESINLITAATKTYRTTFYVHSHSLTRIPNMFWVETRLIVWGLSNKENSVIY